MRPPSVDVNSEIVTCPSSWYGCGIAPVLHAWTLHLLGPCGSSASAAV